MSSANKRIANNISAMRGQSMSSEEEEEEEEEGQMPQAEPQVRQGKD